MAKLFAAFLYRPEPDMYRGTIAAYIERLECYPLWIISRGRQRLVDKGGKFPPSAGDFKLECDLVLNPFGVKSATASLKLCGPVEPPVDPEMSARVGEMFAALSRELALKSNNPEIRRRAGAHAHSEKIRQEAEARLAQLYAERDKPISLSPEALAIFKEATNPPKSLEDLEREVLR